MDWKELPTGQAVLKYQFVSDLFIALAYFSIPLELVYFVKKSTSFPYRWVFMQFGAFIVLCGLTHMLNLWTLYQHSIWLAFVMTVTKALTALVSCATVLSLFHIIPDLLSVKTRELFLKTKAAELDREMGLIRTQEETGRHVRMLTTEIRSTLDMQSILNTTLVELGKTLNLQECALWMPLGDELTLTHTLNQKKGRLGANNHLGARVPKSDPAVKQALCSHRAISICSTSPIARITANTKVEPASYNMWGGDVVGVRVPLLNTASFWRYQCSPPWNSRDKMRAGIGYGTAGAVIEDGTGVGASNLGVGRFGSGAKAEWDELRAGALESGEFREPPRQMYALLVLVLPFNSARRWHLHELELVEVVADQVAVALSHAAILEDSLHDRALLEERNAALEIAKKEAEAAIRARSDFLAVLNHEMRTPMHSIVALSAMLQETPLRPEQRSTVDKIIQSSNILSTLISDVLDLSRMEDGSLELDCQTFHLPSVFKEALNLVKPIANLKGLSVSLQIAVDVPEVAFGDDKRLMQTCLNVVGNACKFTSQGSVSIKVCQERPDYPRDPKCPNFRLQPGDRHFYLRVQVRDTGMGLSSEDLDKILSGFLVSSKQHPRQYRGSGLGLALCKRFVSLMNGIIWIESEGVGKGATVTFVVKLGYSDSPLNSAQQGKKPKDRLGLLPIITPRPLRQLSSGSTPSPQTGLTGMQVLAVDDNSANLMVTRGLLERLGCEVTAVTSGAECLKALEKTRSFRFVLLDIIMPGMDGYEVALRIQERYARSERPLLVAITASNDKRTRERCLGVGMEDVLFKPVSLDRMRTTLTELLQKNGKNVALSLSPAAPPLPPG